MQRHKPIKYVCEHITDYDRQDTAQVSLEKIKTLSLHGVLRMCPKCSEANQQAIAGLGRPSEDS